MAATTSVEPPLRPWMATHGTSFTVISGFSGSPGAFDPAIQYRNAGAFQGSGKSLTVDYNESDITLTVVPEPSTLGLVGICAFAALLRRRCIEQTGTFVPVRAEGGRPP